MIHSTDTWPWKLTYSFWYAQIIILDSVALVPSVIFCPQMPQNPISASVCSVTPWLLQFSPVRLPSVSLKQTAISSKQRCSPCPESSQNWSYLSSSCFSPMAAHCSRIQYKRFFVLQLPQPDHPGRSTPSETELHVYSLMNQLARYALLLILPFWATVFPRAHQGPP